jgi:putative thiamine transport system ATP-binding protein
MLQVTDLQFGYDAPLVRGMSFIIEAGKIHLLHGPSGCGKSSLLAILSGTADKMLKWQGQITLDGVDIGQLPASQRGVGLMFQDPLLFPHMTVGDNLAFGLTATRSGRTERRQAVLDALHECGLDGFAERDPASLSGGQKARVALMRALLAAPKMLLLDEAFSSLDPDLRQTFGNFVANQVAMRQIPALLVSHDAGDKSLTSGAIIQFSGM